MATTPAPMAEAPAATISPFGRVIGVFFSPKATFEDIVRKPSWLLPFALFIAVVVAVCVSINLRMNWHDYIGQQMDKSPQAVFTYVFGIGLQIIIVFAVTLVMWGAYSLLGGVSTNFSTALGITSHAFMTSLVSSPLFILTAFLKPYGTLDLENPLASNLAVLLPEDSVKWLVALGKSFDIFVFWILILLAIGFAAVNPKKLKGAKPFTIAFTVWAVFTAIRVGGALIFS
jgi:hypothetical protein